MKMTMMAVLVAGVATVAFGTLQASGIALVDDQMGLSRTSVFDDPSPDIFRYPQTEPFAAKALPRAYSGAPPMVPHKIDAFLPIKSGQNLCISCHDRPNRIGKAKAKGIATPMPKSHYYKVKGGSFTPSGAHYICVQCHTPQAEVKDLVGNTFSGHN